MSAAESRPNVPATQAFVMEPADLVLDRGQSVDVVIRAGWAYSLGVQFRSTDDNVAQVTGGIPMGGSEGVAHITAIAGGRAEVMLVVWSFGRGPSLVTIGSVTVTGAPLRRRAVRH